MNKKGFTLVELLVAVTILATLVSMASGVYVIYLRESDEKLLRYNLNTMRSSIQHFYLDNGRYPLDGIDYFGNQVSFLDSNTSELVQGVHSGLAIYPEKRYSYLRDIPIDPTTNTSNWKIIPHDSDGDWVEATDDLGKDGIVTVPPDYGEGNGIPDRGEPHVDEDPLNNINDDGDGFTDEDPPDVLSIKSANKEFAHY
jgi:general secretion pathway protein G